MARPVPAQAMPRTLGGVKARPACRGRRPSRRQLFSTVPGRPTIANFFSLYLK